MRFLTLPKESTQCLPAFWRIPFFTLVLILATPPDWAAGETDAANDARASTTAQPDLAENTDSPASIDSTDEQVPTFDPAGLAQAREDRLRYEQVISALENASTQNVYNPELTEAYLGLASAMEVLGENEAAAAVFDQALQTVRISNGLNSLQQLPILEQLLDNHLARENWEDVDNFTYLIFHISRRNFPVGNLRRVEALNRLGAWKFKAIHENLSGGGSRSAFEILNMFRSEITLLEETEDFVGKGIQMATLHLGEARGQLAVVRQINERPLSDYRTTSQQTITQQQCLTIRLPSGQITTICETVETPNIDYYPEPLALKNREMGIYLDNIRDALNKTFEALQQDGDIDTRTQLAEEMHSVTQAYNTFIIENRL